LIDHQQRQAWSLKVEEQAESRIEGTKVSRRQPSGLALERIPVDAQQLGDLITDGMGRPLSPGARATLPGESANRMLEVTAAAMTVATLDH
jgi:hypothetical protein